MPADPPRVALQFHPDWLVGHGHGLVLDAIVRDGVYRSQFETGISNGGLTAVPGGDRWRWESRLFSGRYDAAPEAERPVYGALERDRYVQGPAVRFGSAYLRLRSDVSRRCTFCFPDSVFEPELVRGLDEVPAVVAAADAAGLDPLDDYVEAHVHGGVRLEQDVEALVLDPSHRGTAVEAIIGSAARSGRHDPQDLKRVWHLLARFGRVG